MSELERWKGRNSAKDLLRRKIWEALEQSGEAIGSPWSTIPHYLGAKEAALGLTKLPQWRSAKVIKSNPDAAQAWVRYFALEQGKRLYTPVPELVKDFPFLLLDPFKLQAAGIDFKDVMYSEGALKHGQRVNFDQIEVIDFAVVGCVAVTASGGRTGKGAGFADLEMGLFRHYGVLPDSTQVATTVHDIQLVEDNLVVMQAHDTPLDIIATPSQLVTTNTELPIPGPIDWDAIQADQLQNIPFLKELRDLMKGC